MNTDNQQIEKLSEQLKLLREQNEKLEITAKFYKMKYEEGLEKLKKEQDELMHNIMGISKYRYHYQYPHAAITADGVVFCYDTKEKNLKLLLIQRGNEPYLGHWALPGGFLDMNDGQKESMEECARRELFEETQLGLKSAEMLQQFHVYSDPDRDPRERVITVAFLALVRQSQVEGGDDAIRAEWISLKDLPPLAFDHQQIIADAVKELKRIICFQPIVFNLLEDTFTMSELQHLYELILETTFDRRNFQKKMLAQGFIEAVGERPENSNSRIPTTYRFIRENFETFKKQGFKLEF